MGNNHCLKSCHLGVLEFFRFLCDLSLPVIHWSALSRGHTSNFLLAQVMRFFQILSRHQRERVAKRVTNSSEFGDKLKAA